LKVALIKAGLPVDDLAGYSPGEPVSLELRARTRSGQGFSLRPYQEQAVASYHAGGVHLDPKGQQVEIARCLDREHFQERCPAAAHRHLSREQLQDALGQGQRDRQETPPLAEHNGGGAHGHPRTPMHRLSSRMSIRSIESS
jgi:hypothetical protein